MTGDNEELAAEEDAYDALIADPGFACVFYGMCPPSEDTDPPMMATTAPPMTAPTNDDNDMTNGPTQDPTTSAGGVVNRRLLETLPGVTLAAMHLLQN